ncbi:arylesterase [Psychroflexus aestuariivivens]|uniref:arylesterase n=1 Tax=Psychroflexus aestuariivivens TaxID=1795040 RepID=UPI000FD94BF1|nr:arylesterase [Psychroflexus aestuariivivens]
MSKFQNKQLLSNTVISFVQKIIKFYYLIPLFLILSCNGNQNKEVTDNSKDETVETQTENTQSVNESKSKSKESKVILCFGDSITAGYGLDDPDQAYPAILQEKIDSLGLNYEVINSGVSGETTAGGKRRIDWILKQDIDIFLLELGANDGLRGVDLSETKRNLQAIINSVQKQSPGTKIILAGMQLPPNMGETYTSEFKQLYQELAKTNDLAFIPFILKDVGGIESLNQSDGIHPTAEGHEIVAQNVWEVLEPMLGGKIRIQIFSSLEKIYIVILKMLFSFLLKLVLTI